MRYPDILIFGLVANCWLPFPDITIPFGLYAMRFVIREYVRRLNNLHLKLR